MMLRGREWRLAALGLALAALTAVGPALHWRLGGYALYAVFAAGALGAFWAAREEWTDARRALVIILVTAALMRAALLFAEPYLSNDILRYIWDGRVQAAGINPYRYVPRAPELAALRDAVIWPHINRSDYAVTIYPPVAQMIFVGITRLGESVLVMKLGMLAFEAGIIAAIIGILGQLGLPPARVAAYAWHPLPVWEIAGNGHIDAAMVALLITGLLLALRGRTLLGGVTVTLGALIKPTALLALPVVWRPWNWKLPALVALTVAAAYVPYLSVGTGVIGFLPGYLQEEGISSGSGFYLLAMVRQITGPIAYANIAYLAAAALVLCGLAFGAALRADRTDAGVLRDVRWLLIVFLVLISPHYPWYFLPVVPFLALSPSIAAWVLSVAGVLLYNVVPDDVLPSYEIRIAVLTGLTLAAIARDLWRERSGSLAIPAGETS
jgi:alpha-1,6-mannosyltransferase